MSEIKDRVPAFPIPGLLGDEFNGMSLRDYFAGQAMQGFNANPELMSMDINKTAEAAYRQADEMIKAREVKP